MLAQLRKPRYIALGAVMLLVAAICLTAGTWQVFRFKEKHHENHLLRHNAHSAVLPVSRALRLTTAADARQRGTQLKFQRVTVTGSYDAAHQVFVRERTVDSTVGFLVLTPLRTTSGVTLLVVRGFVAADNGAPATTSAAPSGTITATARVEPAETSNDRYGRSGQGQVSSINPVSTAKRLGTPVYDGYVELLAKQPGTSGLTAIPDPDLSNPAGGAIEPQHLAYILQWFLFALLALAAPLVMARAESRDPDAEENQALTLDDLDDPPARSPEETERAKRLADRYGGVRTP